MPTFAFNRRSFQSEGHWIQSGRRCASPIPTDLETARVAEDLAATRSARLPTTTHVEIEVRFKHLTDRREGQVSEDRRIQQIDVLNGAYDGNVTFLYDFRTVVTVDNPYWYTMGHHSAAERECKAALHDDPKRYLNFYTASLQSGLLGWATFPHALGGDPAMDGVVMLEGSLPGGDRRPYNLGLTAVHEAGHWLGLYHTFQPRGDCTATADSVSDTPNHKDPDFGKPQAGPSCDGGMNSPVHNPMNYTQDSWMTDRFTRGQVQRIFEQTQTYRSELLADPPDETDHLDCDATARGTLRDKEEKTYQVWLDKETEVTLEGPDDTDFDLYSKKGSQPTKTDYDQRSYKKGSHEKIIIKPTTKAKYYLMVRSYRGAGPYILCLNQ